jgi:phosphoribosylanthranilate isomerase
LKVKICGITNIEDAEAAIEAGADSLGFNFYTGSPRYVSPATARAIGGHIRSAGRSPTLVGVFVNSPLDEIVSILRAADLDLAQLHGDESADMVVALKGRAFKALRPASRAEAELLATRYAPHRSSAPALLIDAYRKGQYGGTGQIGDWSLAAQLAEKYAVLLAGGLTPDNVAAAIQQVKPWGVDVASGVEVSPGRKDVEKMRLFVERCQRTGSTIETAANRQRTNDG